MDMAIPLPFSVQDPLGWVNGLATDLQTVADGLESVTFQSTRNDGSLTDTYPSVLRRAVTAKEAAASGGAYAATDVVFLVPAIWIQPGIRPKAADVVIDSEQNRFTVLESAENKKRQTWRLVTRNLAIAYSLGHWVDIEKASISYDRAGVEIQTYPEDGGGSIAYANFLCRVQLVTENEVDERLLRGFSGDYAIYLNQQIVFTQDFNKYRVRWKDKGVTHFLDILGYRQAEQIAELPLLECKIKP